MKKILLLLLLSMSLFITSCADFWAPGIRIYKVETFEQDFTFTNQISATVSLGEIHLHNHNTNTLLIILSNYVDAGGWSVGSNFIENNLLYTISSNGGTNLSVSQSAAIQPDYWEIYGVGSKIHIYLPQSVDIESLILDTATGRITVDCANTFKRVDLSTDTGSVDCISTLSTETLEIQTDTGSVEADILRSESVIISTDTGSIRINSEVSASNIQINSETASIDIKTKNLKDMTVSTSTGSIEVDVLSFFSSIADVNISANTGSIDLKLADLTDVAVNATVTTGSINNALSFESQQEAFRSFTGKNQAGSRIFTLHTSTGSIELDPVQ